MPQLQQYESFYTEALSILLCRLCYSARFSDLVLRFVRSVPQTFCDTRPIAVHLICEKQRNLLETFDQPWLRLYNLKAFADAVHEKRAVLDCVCGFFDGISKACS